MIRENIFEEVYNRFKLNFYRNIFSGGYKGKSNLTATETFCVEVIYSLKSPTVNEVADFLRMSQPNMTYKINNLEKKGYVKKIPSKKDKREVIVEVTDKFHHEYEIKNQYIYAVLERTKEKLSKKDYEKFYDILNNISEELISEFTD